MFCRTEIGSRYIKKLARCCHVEPDINRLLSKRTWLVLHYKPSASKGGLTEETVRITAILALLIVSNYSTYCITLPE